MSTPTKSNNKIKTELNGLKQVLDYHKSEALVKGKELEPEVLKDFERERLNILASAT